MPYQIKNWDRFQHYKNRNPIWIKLYRSLHDDFEYMSLPLETQAILTHLWIFAAEENDGVIRKSDDEIAWRLHLKEEDFKVSAEALISRGFIITLADCYQDASKPLADCYQHPLIDIKAKRSRGEEKQKNLKTSKSCPNRQKTTGPDDDVLDTSARSQEDKSAAADPSQEATAETVDTRGLSKRQFALFSRFYEAYPRRVKPNRAAKAWKAIRPAPDEALLGRMLESIEAMKRIPGWDREDMRYVLHPSSWLNAGSWEDELPTQKSGMELVREIYG